MDIQRFVTHRHYSKLVLVFSLALILPLIYGMLGLQKSDDYQQFFEPDDERLMNFENVKAEFTSTDVGFFMLEFPKSGGAEGELNFICTNDGLNALQALTERAWRLPYSTRVDSIQNYQHITGLSDELVIASIYDVGEKGITRAGLDEEQGMFSQNLGEICQLAYRESDLRNRLISEDARSTAVSVTYTLPENSSEALKEIKAAQARLVEDFRQDYPYAEIYVTGTVPMNIAFTDAVQYDMDVMYPIMYVVIFLVIFIAIGSLKSTLGIIVVLGLSLVFAMGIGGLMGIVITTPVAMAPVMITTVVLADCIHLFYAAIDEKQAGAKSDEEALAKAIASQRMGIFLTSVFTILGFVSLNFSNSPPIKDLGNITAMGVFAAMVLSLTFLPAFLRTVGLSGRRFRLLEGPFFGVLSRFTIRKSRSITSSFVLVVILALAGISSIRIVDALLEYFDESMTFRAQTEYITDRLTSIYHVQFEVPVINDEETFTDPAYLKRLERFEQWLLARSEVRNVQSIAETMRRLNKALNADDETHYVLPDNQALAAQYFLMYEFSLPQGLDATNLVNMGKTSTQIIVNVNNLRSDEMKLFVAESEAWLAEQGMPSTAVGAPVMFSYISEENIWSMIRSLGYSIVLISVFLMMIFKSVRLGLVSLVPNLVPMVMAFGLWGVIVGEVNFAVAVVIGIVYGIVVDDTVHFMLKYKTAFQKTGCNQRSIDYAMTHVGPVILLLTLFMLAGFSVLMISNFLPNATMGVLTNITVVMALICDLLLLPAILAWVKPLGSSTPREAAA